MESSYSRLFPGTQPFSSSYPVREEARPSPDGTPTRLQSASSSSPGNGLSSSANRHLRLQLQRRLLEEETAAQLQNFADEEAEREEAVMIEPEDINFAADLASVFTALPRWSYAGALLLLAGNVLVAENPYAGVLDQDDCSWGLWLRAMAPLICLCAGVLQRLGEDLAKIDEKANDERHQGRACLRKALSAFANDLSKLAAFSLEQGVGEQEIHRAIAGGEKWLKKLAGTPEAMIRPVDLAERLHAVRKAFIPAREDWLLGVTHADSAKAKLVDAFRSVMAAYDADCNDAALEALEHLEKTIDVHGLRRLPTAGFIADTRAMFKDKLLRTVADLIAQSGDRKRDEGLEIYLELKSLLSEELGLRTRNRYMQFRTVSALTGEEVEYALQTVLGENTDEAYIDYLSGDLAEVLADYLETRYPALRQWHAALKASYVEKFYEAGQLSSETGRIDSVASLTAQMKSDTAQVMRDYVRPLLNGNPDRLDDLERRLKKEIAQATAI